MHSSLVAGEDGGEDGRRPRACRHDGGAEGAHAGRSRNGAQQHGGREEERRREKQRVPGKSDVRWGLGQMFPSLAGSGTSPRAQCSIRAQAGRYMGRVAAVSVA